MRIGQSPLARAAETAQLINERLARSAVLESDVDLREAEFSRYLQGLPYWQVPLPRPPGFVDKGSGGRARETRRVAGWAPQCSHLAPASGGKAPARTRAS